MARGSHRVSGGLGVLPTPDCERHGVGYVVGLARNRVFEREASVACEAARDGFEATGTKSRLFAEFGYAARTRKRRRRVIARIEHTEKGRNPRFVVFPRCGSLAEGVEQQVGVAPIRSGQSDEERPVVRGALREEGRHEEGEEHPERLPDAPAGSSGSSPGSGGREGSASYAAPGACAGLAAVRLRREACWMITFPRLAVFLTTLSSNLLASWLRTVTDPVQRRRSPIRVPPPSGAASAPGARRRRQSVQPRSRPWRRGPRAGPGRLLLRRALRAPRQVRCGVFARHASRERSWARRPGNGASSGRAVPRTPCPRKQLRGVKSAEVPLEPTPNHGRTPSTWG